MHKIIKKYLTIKSLVIALAVAGLYSALFVLYYSQFTSFIFFDEVANIVAGHFFIQGKLLYSEQFFNHQMLPVYLSSLIQLATQPDSLYQVIMYHRIFVFLVSAIAGVFLILRLRWVGVGVIIVYELIKYYFFGYLFLAEGIIVYIHIFLFYLGWKKLLHKTISTTDLILASLGTWFVVWSREPYVPLAIVMFVFLLIEKKLSKKQLYSFGVFLILSLITFITVPIQEYLYQVVYVNYETVFSYQLESNAQSNLGLFSMFFYPVFVFFSGESNFLRIFLIGISGVFLLSLSYFFYRTKNWKLIIYILIILGVANVRMVQPGTMYYSAFYQIQWIGIFLIAIFLLIREIFKLNKKLSVGLILVITGFVGYTAVQSDSYITRSVDRNALFAFQYDKYLVTGKTVDLLASPGDTLHVDFSESLLYWQSKTPPAFEYQVYYPVMHDIDKYRKQRLSMFENNPPTFYYFNCFEAKSLFNSLPERVRFEYAPIQFTDQSSCLYILKSRARQLNQQQLEEIQQYGYRLDPSAIE